MKPISLHDVRLSESSHYKDGVRRAAGPRCAGTAGPSRRYLLSIMTDAEIELMAKLNHVASATVFAAVKAARRGAA